MTSPCQQDEQRSSPVPRDSIESLRAENIALRRDLEDCKDQLFDVLQKGNDITESDIKAAFSRVYSGIDAWIDELGSEDDYEEAFRTQFKTIIQDSTGSRLASLGFHRRCYLDVKWRVTLSNLPHCFHIIMSMIISNFLTEQIFRTAKADEWGHLYPHGLSEPEIINLVHLQAVMRTMLRRGESEISRWRGQSISAMILLEGAKKEAKEASAKHIGALQRKLEDWLGRLIPQPLLQSLTEKVIDRANKSLELMCCSNKTYVIGSLEFPPGPIDEHSEARAWHLRDLATWRKMSPQANGDLLQCFHPGLMRIGESGQDDLMLVKPTWIGYEKPGQLPEDLPQTSTSRSSSPRKQSSTMESHSGKEHKTKSRKPRSQGSWFTFGRSSAKSTRSKTAMAHPADQYSRHYTGETNSDLWVSPTGPGVAEPPRRGSTFPADVEEYYDQTKRDSRSRRSLSH